MRFIEIFLLHILCAVFYITGQPPTDSVACYFWEDAIYRDGHCYKLFVEGRKSVSRENAEDACASKTSGGKLAEVYSNKLLEDLLMLTKAAAAYDIWLGPTTNNATSSLVNPSTPSYPITIPDGLWEIGEPEYSTHSPSCLVATPLGKLEMEECWEEAVDGYICQQEADNVCDVFLPGSEYFKGRCFKHEPQLLNYTMAKTKCSLKKLFLAEPNTPDLFNFVREMAQKFEGSEWIGGEARAEHGYTMTWWKSGQLVGTNKVYWGSNPALEQYDQMAMEEEVNDRWKTRFSEDRLTSICQYDGGNPCEWLYPGSVYADGSCLKLYTTPMTWKDAKEHCTKQSAKLVELTSDALFHAANQLAKTVQSPSDVFIGLNDVKKEGHFMWAASGEGVTSLYWAEDQPNNTLAKQDYVAIGSVGFDWLVLDNEATKHYICQKNIKKPQTAHYTLPVPDLYQYDNSKNQSMHLHIVTGVASHKVYVKLSLTSQVFTSTMRYYVTRDEPLKIELTKEIIFGNEFGLNVRRIRLITSHTVSSVSLSTVQNNVKSRTVLLPNMLHKTTLSSFLISTSGLSSQNEGEIESRILVQPPFMTTDITFRFPDHVRGIVLLNIQGIHMNVTGDIKLTVKPSETAVVKLTGPLDGLFVYASHLVLVVISSHMTNPSVPGGVSYVTSPVLPSLVTPSFYVTFPTIADHGNDMEDKNFYDIYTIISLADDNDIKVIGAKTTVHTLDTFGMVKSFKLASDQWFSIAGSYPFYLIKHIHWMKEGKARNPCRTNIIPRRLWQKHYILDVTLDPEVQKVTMFLNVPDPYHTDVIIDGLPTILTCRVIPGSKLHGCYTNVTAMLFADGGASHHVHIKEYVIAFGAYVIVTSENAVMCQPLGITKNTTPKYPAIPLDTVYNFQPVVQNTTTTSTMLPPMLPTMAFITASPPPPTTTTIEINKTGAESTYSTVDTTTSQSLSSIITQQSLQPIPSLNLTEEEKYQMLVGIEEELIIDARSTSAYIRRKTSAVDVRMSSTTIGLVGVAVIIVVFGFIVGSDIISAVTMLFFGGAHEKQSGGMRKNHIS